MVSWPSLANERFFLLADVILERIWRAVKVKGPIPGARPVTLTLEDVRPIPDSATTTVSSPVTQQTTVPASPATPTTPAPTPTVGVSAARNAGSGASLLTASILRRNTLLASAAASAEHKLSTSGQHLAHTPAGYVSSPALTSEQPSQLDPADTTSRPSRIVSVHFSLPSPHRPPLLDVDCTLLFSKLEPANIVTLFNCLLCELPILVVASRIEVLTPCLDALLALMFPLSWPYIYIPLLPSSLTEMLNAPVPFLCGTTPDALAGGASPLHAVIVDLDGNKVYVNEPDSVFDGAERKTTATLTTSAGPAPVATHTLTATTTTVFLPPPQSPDVTYTRLPWRLSWRLHDCIIRHFAVFQDEHPNVRLQPPRALPANARARRKAPPPPSPAAEQKTSATGSGVPVAGQVVARTVLPMQRGASVVGGALASSSICCVCITHCISRSAFGKFQPAERHTGQARCCHVAENRQLAVLWH